MNLKYIDKTITTIRREIEKNWGKRGKKKRDPFKVLFACLISLRTKDEVTDRSAERLFSVATNATELLNIPVRTLEKIIYPAGFYRIKAKNMKQIAGMIIEKYDSKIPDTMEELLKLPGVGRKTANLVLTQGFGKYGICVDTHVHRITNRWGYVRTKSPEQTEMALRDKLPKKYWKEINGLLVTYGQKICTPLSPRCSICKIERICDKVGVERRR